jgi:hypothetical protein
MRGKASRWTLGPQLLEREWCKAVPTRRLECAKLAASSTRKSGAQVSTLAGVWVIQAVASPRS